MIESDLQAAGFEAHTSVSRETMDMYKHFNNHLSHWNKKINLVSSGTIDSFWSRHALDSFQLTKLLPSDARTFIDLGSGAGFPGISFAIAMRDTPDALVSMVESNGKKCNFLRTIIRELKLPARVLQGRVEKVDPEPYDVISARAFAPLPRLLEYASRFWGASTLGLFPKGTHWEQELIEAQKLWTFSFNAKQSETETEARILLIENLSRRNAVTSLGKEK